MAWIRRGTHRYFCLSVRRGKAVRQVHYGNGDLAVLAAGLDELRRSDHRARRDDRLRHEAAAGLLEGLCRATGLLAEAALSNAGFHRHDRGRYRRRRMGHDDVKTAGAPLTPGRVREVLQAAREGDRTALPMLRQVLDAHPEILQAFGDLAAHAQRVWVDLAAGADLVVRESLALKLAALKAEIAGPAPTPLERLLIDRVAACWVQVHHADAVLGQAKDRDLSLAQLDHLERRSARAQKSYLAAIKAVATIRRLVPAASKPSAVVPECIVETLQRQSKEAHRIQQPKGVDKSPKANKKGLSNGRPQQPIEGRPKKTRGSVVPESLRARMRGLVASEN